MVDLNMQVVQPVRLSPTSRFRFRCHPGVPASRIVAAKPLSS